MGKDIQPLLDNWPYDPEKLCVRRIKGADGREKIQLRIEMGILQMEISGRPDGRRPYGHESLLSYYQEKSRSAERDENGKSPFSLDTETCMALQMEALQYYHRRISFLELGEYQCAQADAKRNLELFDFVKEYADDDEDRLAMEQYRPFVIGHRVRAAVLEMLEQEEFDLALSEIDRGVNQIQEFLGEFDRQELVDENEEIAFLKEWADEIRKDRPKSLLQDLKEQLSDAVAIEDFERAAELRDRLKALSGTDY
ncbi:MAG: UvrB/UvrC motif-containing protein [bacterium]|nr:UvrB/UvrC motif-containing protein [bacterium]